MISEGSCDTEDWTNDAENSALITEINIFLKYIQIEVILNCGKFHNITVCTVFFYCISDQMNAALVSIRDFFQKTFAKLLNVMS